jgi:hypothetical protein
MVAVPNANVKVLMTRKMMRIAQYQTALIWFVVQRGEARSIAS